MTPSFPTRNQLSSMSITKLRSLDIRERDEEEIVQEILNVKIASSSQPFKVDLPFVDIRTKEQEEKRQREIDEANEKSKASLLQGLAVETPPEVLLGEKVSPLEVPLEEPVKVEEPVKGETPKGSEEKSKKRGRPKKTK